MSGKCNPRSDLTATFDEPSRAGCQSDSGGPETCCAFCMATVSSGPVQSTPRSRLTLSAEFVDDL